MSLNLAQFLPSNLQAQAVKLGLYALALVTIFSTGFYSGCTFKQNQWDAEKFHAMERAQKQEKKDTKEGQRTVENLKGDQGKTEGARVFIKEEIKKNSQTTKVVCPSVDKVVTVSTIDKPAEEIKDENAPIVLLTPNAMRLYDVSARPQDIELRTRTYDSSAETTVDEGFEKIIRPNNLICADNYNQLMALRQRILDKQKSFPDSVD